jgi:O-succinylbenzoate synthase
MPGDTAASANYWHKDIIQPEVTVEDGVITVPKAAGIGYEVDYAAVDEFTSYSKRYTK